jgi:hypothetical protein
MIRRTSSQIARKARGGPASPMRRAAAVVIALPISAAVLAGCGHLVVGAGPASAGAGPGSAAASAATANAAAATNSGCAQAAPVVQSALSELTLLQHHAVTPAQARSSLASEVTVLERLSRATPDSVLQQSLANAYDAFTAFQAVMQNPNAPAYPDAFFNLLGTLSGFQRACSVVDSEVANGTSGGAAASVGTTLTRSATAHDASWSLQVTNKGTDAATAGFTDAPSSVSPTLKGSEQIGLWARALTGTPTVTLQVRELVGDTVVGTQQVTMKLDPTFRFEYLTYQVRRPGASRLSVTVSAASLAPSQAFLVDDVTIVRD